MIRRGAPRRGIALVSALLACACTGRSLGSVARSEAFSLPHITGGPARPAHVLLVSVAGLTPDRYLGVDGRTPDMPTVATLGRSGVLAEAMTPVTPATKYPAHASLVTGERPAKHGVTADLLLGDHGVRATRYWHASHLRVPTLWQLATDADLLVASLGWPSTVGASIDLLLPDLVPTRRGETWLGVLADAATPSVIEMAKRHGGNAVEANYPGINRDNTLTGVACEIVARPNPPALLLLHLSQTEAALAATGPSSDGARAAFARADAGIARVLSCMNRAGILAQSAVVVVGDHGVMPVHTRVSLNSQLAEKGLLVPAKGAGEGLARWDAVARSNGGSAFVYAHKERLALLARRAFEEQAERTRAFHVVTSAEMIRLGADPDAWFGVEALPGFAFVDGVSAPFLYPAARRSVGGYVAGYREMDAGFVAWGRGIRSGVRVPTLRQTDVAPTVARLMGLELGDVDGRPLIGAFR